MTNLRKLARDQPCQVRVPLHCNGDPATTVLAHYRMASLSGIGMKAPDVFGAWCCSKCHDLIDGRARSDYTRIELHWMHAEGVFRTQAALLNMGKIKV